MYILKQEHRNKKLPLLLLEKDLAKVRKCDLQFYEAVKL